MESHWDHCWSESADLGCWVFMAALCTFDCGVVLTLAFLNGQDKALALDCKTGFCVTIGEKGNALG